MTESQTYLERVTSLLALAAHARTEEARLGFRSLAGAYAQLARDAATFERSFGASLTGPDAA
jgi:hypothetical protein